MLSAALAETLAQAELRFSAASTALLKGEPLALASAGVQLRQAALEVSAVVQGLSPRERSNQKLIARLQRLTEGLACLRENLIRRSVLVERALHAIVPATRSATYAQQASAPYASTPYASAGKQTGAFKLLAA